MDKNFLDPIMPYVNFPTYLIGFGIVFVCFLFGCYVSRSMDKEDGIEEGHFFGTALVSIIWPLTIAFFAFVLLDYIFKFFAKIVASKYNK